MDIFFRTQIFGFGYSTVDMVKYEESAEETAVRVTLKEWDGRGVAETAEGSYFSFLFIFCSQMACTTERLVLSSERNLELSGFTVSALFRGISVFRERDACSMLATRTYGTRMF